MGEGKLEEHLLFAAHLKLFLNKIFLNKKSSQVSTQQVAELALIPYKDAKELLYTLYTQNFLEIQELHRTPDFSPLRTFYLFHVPIEKLTLKLLNVCYKAIFNLMSIRKDNLNVSYRDNFSAVLKLEILFVY